MIHSVVSRVEVALDDSSEKNARLEEERKETLDDVFTGGAVLPPPPADGVIPEWHITGVKPLRPPPGDLAETVQHRPSHTRARVKDPRPANPPVSRHKTRPATTIAMQSHGPMFLTLAMAVAFGAAMGVIGERLVRLFHVMASLE
jgi:hypothetical protein